MKKSTWWIVGVVVVVVIILVISGTTRSTETGPIKIGMITPLSGNVVALGELMKQVTDIAVSEVNDAGGVNGRPLSILYEDDQCTPAKSVSAVQKLIDIDKVKIVIGSSCSGSVLSVLPITDKDKVFLISGSATSPALNNKSQMFVRTIANDDTEGLVLAEMAISKGWKKIGFLQENSDYALGLYNAFTKNYPESVGTIIHEEYPESTTDFRSVLTKIRAAKPDALFIAPQSPATSQRILTNLAQLKWVVPLMADHVVSGAWTIKHILKHNMTLCIFCAMDW
ncbi:MAG: ABC transporter substrate-binding protein [Candidatus Taylorbacteria bacterium]|nr:ABC transporter substrate-binding protein [Candidatus Taylorbacteria bacterium]